MVLYDWLKFEMFSHLYISKLVVCNTNKLIVKSNCIIMCIFPFKIKSTKLSKYIIY